MWICVCGEKPGGTCPTCDAYYSDDTAAAAERMAAQQAAEEAKEVGS